MVFFFSLSKFGLHIEYTQRCWFSKPTILLYKNGDSTFIQCCVNYMQKYSAESYINDVISGDPPHPWDIFYNYTLVYQVMVAVSTFKVTLALVKV